MNHFWFCCTLVKLSILNLCCETHCGMYERVL